MDRKTFKALSLALAIGAAGVAATAASADEGRFYIAPGVQWMDFDSDRQSRDETGYNLGIGYGLSDNLSTELTYSRISMNTLAGRDRLRSLRLDLLYKFDNKIGALSPYFVGGLGDADLNAGKDTTLNVGAGFSYRLNDIAEWRTAARTFYGIADRTFDLGIETGMVFHLGSAAPAARVEPSAAAPSTAPATAVVADADGDGVPDGRDACPDTPRNYAVDARGCPIMTNEVARIDLTVQFDFDQSVVKPEFFEDIRRVADFLAANDDVVAVVEGHTDSAGSDEYNQSLSERRAAAVRQVLIERFGVSAARVTSVGYGESRPVTSNETADGRAQNRRVVGSMTATMQRPQLRN
ncbi:OmpA family protein [Gammaproteobacteria bacterium LSUCC0112]|nr:OmpA family protein [Gammaproteobacteria bacterium LSUCC0112]